MAEDPILAIRQLLIQCVWISGVTEESWTEENLKSLDKFILDTSIPSVVFYLHTSRGLQVDFTAPSMRDVVGQLCFMIRKPGAVITEDWFEEVLQIHTLKGGNLLKSFLQDMACMHAPTVALSDFKDKNTKDQYTKEMHCFNVFLTEEVYKQEGKTVLYVPMEAMLFTPEQARKDKDFIIRMEMMMIHWTDQIKELLNEAQLLDFRDSCGPLQEIEFWKSRTTKLSQVKDQLNKPEIQHIQKILQHTKSLYVERFCELSVEIKNCTEVAQSNLEYISILKEPCEELSQLSPRQVTSKLKHIISLIRVIWNNAPYYDKERITGLFCQVNNEIIRVCSQSISLDKIFENNSSCKEVLDDCIYCCQSWKKIYLYLKEAHLKFSDKDWELDETRFFLVTDAFIQRLRTLLEVCDYQHQFLEVCQQKEMGFFRGHKGPELACMLQNIQANLLVALQNLRTFGDCVFDLKDSRWNNEFHSFCTVVEDLGRMMENLISSAFMTVNTLQEGIRLLYFFQPMTTHENIRLSIEKKSEEVYDIFKKDLKMVNAKLNQEKSSYPNHVSKLVGQAMKAKGFKDDLNKSMKLLQLASFMPRSHSYDQLLITYNQLVHEADEIVRKNFLEWVQKLDTRFFKRVEQPLLIRTKETPSRLDVNMDNNLRTLFSDVRFWEQQKYETPQKVYEILKSWEDISILRDDVHLLALNYNRIIEMLTPDELGLFRHRLHFIDKKIEPGLSKLLFINKGTSKLFVNDCLSHVEKLQSVVDGFNVSIQSISSNCQLISETLLVNIDGVSLYRNLEFEDNQKAHQQSHLQILRSAHQNIISVTTQIHDTFAKDGAEVQKNLVSYVEKVDSLVEKAFLFNIRDSMKKLSIAINGRHKLPPNPLFKVRVVLRQSSPQTPSKVEFSPSLSKLAEIVNILPQLINIISEFKRVPELLFDTESQANPVFFNIEQDEKIKKNQASINAGMTTNASNLQAYVKTWDKYRAIWEVNKDNFIQRYKRLNPLVSSFDADIQRYLEKANSVQQEEEILNIHFVTLDFSSLKYSLVVHCKEWQTKFIDLLCEMAIARLQELCSTIEDGTNRLQETPQTLADLDNSLKLHETLMGNLDKTESQISVAHEPFALLDKYEVSLESSVQKMRDKLNDKWVLLNQVLADSKVKLQKQKETFRNSCLQSHEQFNKKVETTVKEFNSKGPFSSKISNYLALNQIAEHLIELETLKQEQDTIRNELVFFSIKQPPSKKIQILEKDMDQLQKVWEFTKEWNDNWNSWKVVQFSNLQMDRMENAAQDMFQKLNVLQQDLKDKEWEIVDFCKSKIQHFKQTIPLIRDLRNPAMRDRHWSQICMELLCLFDHTSADFTLEKILSLGLDLYSDKIIEISRAASNELPLEQGLESISKTWKEMLLDIQPFGKNGHFLLRNTEFIHQTFDDNQVTLSTMKTSQFIKPFVQELNQWQQQLSHMMEVVEMILTVQRHWVCLENIFQEKVILHDCEEFAGVSASWKTIMSRLHEKNNALQGTQQPGLLENLSQMNTKLEKIRKSLDEYLQTKCQIFPRFYFMSNDDILEALGQPENPQAMQPHMKKCFSNINSLQLKKKGKKKIAVGIFSADGEKVEFDNPVELDKPVEVWLCDIEQAMSSTLKITLHNCVLDLKKSTGQRNTCIQDWPGQMIIVASQINWTSDVTQSLEKYKDRSTLLSLKKKQVSVLHSYSKMICENLPKVLRLKTEALITVEVHARDVTDKLLRADCYDVNAFEWLCQLRHYLEKDMSYVKQCCIQQMNTQFKYGYEYLGNSGRLVITPLTDRCYMTLTTALHLHRGGSLKGPSATGKTETVKDLGKTLGMFVIVFSCSEGLDYKSLGRIFCGLAQTGAWGCFDDFNRINTEVLSMVGQQTLSILSALSAGQSDLFFEGNKIRLNPACGIFVTMNPGYAGRTELPDNLKFQFRSVSMVVPDSTMIAMVLLFAAGFNNCKRLAKKVFTLYTLAAQLLSKQHHYDFGLHTLTSLLRYAGNKRHSSPSFPDEDILVMAIKDMTVPKLTSADLTLFNGLIQDLFHPVKTPIMDHSKLKEAIELELQQRGLQVTPFTMTKIIQLYENKNSQRSSMLVGKTGSAKTVTWRTLQNALTALQQKGEPGFQRVQVYPLSPKSLSLGELYGEKDLSSNEWTDGVLSSLMRSVCADENSDEKWIVFDGPVDTLWIESMNSVMDDNKVLTLVNGERILVPEQVSFLFEVENLAMASPATVSRCGVVYNNYADLGWRPFVNSWLEKRHKAEVEHLKILFDKYVESTVNFKRTNCRELIPTTELNGIMSLCHLYESLATPTKELDTSETKTLGKVVELWFIFSLIWSICASVDEDGRRKINNFLREINHTFPSEGTIYEYYVNPRKETWDSFEEQLPNAWRYSPTTPFYEIVVPTLDTVRYNFLIKALVLNQYPVLLTGSVGTGKTVVAQSVLQGLESKWASLTINMSSQITCNNIQAIIKSRTEQKNKVVFMPANGKQMLCFLDDLNMPAHDPYGSQPPLEMLRFWIDYGFWYIRQKPNQQFVKNMSLMASMGPPGGGRTQISARLQSRFSLINMTFPEESKIKSIFGSIINQKLQLFKEEVKPVGDAVTQATLELFNIVAATFLPTPAKAHYLFNLRDISKVFQGLLRARPDIQETQEDFARLWLHECYRVFSDRLVNQDDLNIFTDLVKNKLASHFSSSFNYIWPNKQSLIFGDFLNKFSDYADIQDMNVLKEYLKAQLGDFNSTAGNVPMNLVFFQDAIKHITRIMRVIRQPRGHMLLIGIEGSGRQSLSKMAAFICGYQVFQVEVTKRYHRQDFRTDIKTLYHLTGVENKPTVLLLKDSQIVDESFLEDINSILSSGEVPNLYKQNELTEVCKALSELGWKDDTTETPESLFSYLMERVRNNLHIVLCMSSGGEPFRKCLLQYPAIINCSTMDWFHEWPKDALLEVAERYLDGLELGSSDNIHRKSASFFETTHQSVKVVSQRMKIEIKRNNYVTPTNYLELLSGYRKMLVEKRSELNKLKNGFLKISDTLEEVEAMSVELKEVKKQMVEFQEENDQFFVVIVQLNKEFSAQQKRVGVYREKTQEEKLQCKEIADNAQKELDMAMPALDEALMALESLNKKDLIEIRTYNHPPALVEMVLKAVMILLDKEPSWEEAKKQLDEADFIKSLINFDKNNISEHVLKKVAQYCTRSDFLPETIGKVSLAAKSLCMWVKAMEVYGQIYKAIEPKRAQLNVAQSQLAETQAAQAEAENKLEELTEKQSHLEKEFSSKVAVQNSLRKESEEMKVKLGQAERLFPDLVNERVHWMERVAKLKKAMECLVGDCLLAASFLSYMGPFPSDYRDELLLIWKQKVVDLEIPVTPGFSFTDFLSKPTMLRDWIIQGLPSDVFSAENGVIITHGNRCPLIVDPQGQAQRWIQNMENDKGLKLIDYRMPDFLSVLEDAVQLGSPVLLHNVQEELDLSLNPVLNKSLTQIGDRLLLKLGDKEVEYNPEFRLYITTKMSSPHYTPDIFSKTTIVNFAFNEQGLEAELLGVVARSEQPDLEQQRDNLLLSISAETKQLQELEDQILKCLLKKTSGSLLDDMELINTLCTNREVTEQLERSQQAMIKIDSTREAYRQCAQRASILFSVMNSMNLIDPMYQFSLDAYISLFTLSVEKRKHKPTLEERMSDLNDYHTYAVYSYMCRALFEAHKLVFSFQMCTKILEVAGKLDMNEYSFFLQGGNINKHDQRHNPCASWLPDSCWDNILELKTLLKFKDIQTSFQQNPQDWNSWFNNSEPEKAPLPGDWDLTCNDLQKMLVVRSLRQDRVSFCISAFIVKHLGPRFVEPPALNMTAVVEESSSWTPLIFILSPGVDPMGTLLQLAEDSGMSKDFYALDLGQGNTPITKSLIEERMKNGHWLFLANCHLSPSWMPELDKLIMQLQKHKPHPNFRLWLSLSPNPEFPITILQAGVKMAIEPPKGVKANMKHLYQLVNETQFSRCSKPALYKKLLLSLCFFHSILLERKKFQQLGWNIIYSFNDSDFEVTENLFCLDLDTFKTTPWDLIAEVIYGGHVTNEWDRRLLTTYIKEYFSEAVINPPSFRLSTLPIYNVPLNGPQSAYKDYIDMLPPTEQPEVFGLHPNADILSHTAETRTLFHTLLSLQPQITSWAGASSEDMALKLLGNTRRKIPAPIDSCKIRTFIQENPSPLNMVLLQEILSYNSLLETISSSLVELEKGIEGLVVMSPSMEETLNCIYDARVPPLWEKAYPSLKPLAAWIQDLCQRVAQFSQWAETTKLPVLFWLSGFIFPNSFLTAVLQSTARQNDVTVDTLSWEFIVSTKDDISLVIPPKDGVYVRGLYLEGAGWDSSNSCLVEAEAMQMVFSIPTINFKPVDKHKKKSRNMYLCPCYYYPARAGRARQESFVVGIELHSGDVSPEHWIKRGTALLMSLDT